MNAEVVSDALWAALAAAVVVMLAASHRRVLRLARISSLVRRLESNGLLYVTVLILWAWAGWHFFAR